jgi:hypothetical protein
MLLPVVDSFAAFWIHRLLWPDGPFAGSQWHDPVDAAISFAAGVAIVSVVMTAAGALPAVAWLAGRKQLSLKPIVLAAIVLGNTPYGVVAIGTVLFYVLGMTTLADLRYVLLDAPVGALRAVLVGSTVGALSGLVFWAIAVAGEYEEQVDGSDGPLSVTG